MVSETTSIEERNRQLESLVARLSAQLESERNSWQDERRLLERERDALRASHERLRLELELLKRRLFVAKAERVDTAQLELEFAAKMRELEEVAGTLGIKSERASTPKRPANKPTGRRDLRTLPLEEERIELSDPAMEALVEQGKLVRHGSEETVMLRRQRGGMRRVVITRQKYKAKDEVNDATGALAVYTTEMPKMMFERSIALPSLIAHIASRKVTEGLPLFRIEDAFSREGIPIDRGMMSRWLEHVGATLGATVVEAMRAHAMKTAFCIATDATGIAIQPVRTHEKQRKPCKRGHFLVQIADRDHVFFEYLERETSAAIAECFRGFSGYVQADAKSVFDALFKSSDDGASRDEVGCWAHARRKFWEAAAAKSVVAREGLLRIGRIFELEATWAKKPPAEIQRLRDTHLRAHVNAFFDWAELEFEKVKHERGILNAALGYATRQKSALNRFLDDGRLVLDNNRSERALRSVAVGRKAWLFAGSDDHATSTSHIFTMVASARLHKLDPEAYLRDLIRVLPHWPRERYLELAPLFWSRTRDRLVSEELIAELGPLTIPDAEQPATNEAR